MYDKNNLPCTMQDLAKARKKVFTYVFRMTEPFEVDTLEGVMPGKAGDYFACSIEDNQVVDVWVIDKDRFDATYEVVEKSLEEQMFEFLSGLRESGTTNMFEAPRYLEQIYGITKQTARDVFFKWTESFK